MRAALSSALVGLVVLSAVAAVPTALAAPAVDGGSDPGQSTPGALADQPASGDASAVAQASDACAAYADGEPPANPDTDRLGWENGCWANESLDVTLDDGLNQSEFDAVIGRSMARVESIREREFESTVPVDLISPEAYRQEFANLTSNVSTEAALHQNAKWEATFIINESTSAVAAQRSTFANGTAGFYDPERDVITIVSQDPSTAAVPELTLGHELVHALQDQHFNTSYNRSTTDEDHAASGITEGDADFVEGLYSQRCEGEWSCLSPESGGGGGGSINLGLQLNALVPYSEGSAFVQSRYRAGGWDAVDEVYANPPASAEQVIHPGAYPDERPRDLAIEHSTSGEWRMLDIEGPIDHATFGEGALYAMMWYATYESTAEAGTVSNVAIPYTHFFNFQPGTGQVPLISPYNYSHPVTDGWDGDRLVPYVTDSSAESGETGYVWRLAWDTPGDAERFSQAYLDVLEYRGAEPVEGYDNVYRIPEGTEFSDAFAVTRDGDTMTIVNGPTVDDLDQIHEDATAESGSGDPTATGTTDGTATPTPTDSDTPSPTETATPSPTPTTSGNGPGFGMVVALVSLLGLALLARGGRRGRN